MSYYHDCGDGPTLMYSDPVWSDSLYDKKFAKNKNTYRGICIFTIIAAKYQTVYPTEPRVHLCMEVRVRTGFKYEKCIPNKIKRRNGWGADDDVMYYAVDDHIAFKDIKEAKLFIDRFYAQAERQGVTELQAQKDMKAYQKQLWALMSASNADNKTQPCRGEEDPATDGTYVCRVDDLWLKLSSYEAYMSNVTEHLQ